MDKTAEMKIFIGAVEQGSFSAAGRALDLTPSAVSKQIQRLEDRLGVRLFNRSTRHIHLTEAGELFHERCKRIVDAIEEAEETVASLREQVRGRLKVSATAAFARGEVLPRLNAFLEQYPDLELQIELTDRPVDVVEEGFDAVIRLQEQVDDPSLIARKLAVNRRIICAAPAYIEAHGMPESPGDLLNHNCLTLYTVSRFNDWEFEGEEDSRVLHVSGNFQANTADALYAAALGGAGLARLSTWLVAPDIRAGRLVPVLPQYTHEKSAYYVLYPHRRHLSPKVRAFVDFLAEQFTPVPPWERERAA